MQPVGELDEEHADILGHGEEELAEIFRLRGALRDKIKPLELRQPVDETANVAAEKLVDFLPCRIGILDRVVQDSRDDGRIVELHVGENRRDFEGMRKKGIAGSASLRPMRLHGIDIGAIERHFVGLRIIAPHPVDKFVLPHHVLCRPATGGVRFTIPFWIMLLRMCLPQILAESPDCRQATRLGPVCHMPSPSALPSRQSSESRQAPAPGLGQSPSSSVSAGGTRPSSPRKRSSSVIRSNCISPMASACTPSGAEDSAGTASASGSSTSTCFCKD